MKFCPKCRSYKQPEEFGKNKKRYDGLQNYCKQCKVINDHRYYLLNKEGHKKRVHNYLIDNKKKIWFYLQSHPCVDCGETNPVVLEFDHVDSKIESVSFLTNYMKCSWKTLQKEIDKCEIRCANCHRIKTAKELDWYKFLGP